MYSSLLVAAALAVGAPALKDKDPTGLVGEWVPEGATTFGEEARAEGPPARWAFRADGTWHILVDGKPVYSGTYTADPTARPRALDLVSAGHTNRCLYRVGGDTLTLAYGHPGADRPAGFEAPKGARCTLAVFTRAKK